MSNQRFYRAADLVGTAKSRRKGERGIIGFSPALLWRKVAAGTFTKPVYLSDGVTAFPSDETDEVMAAYATGAGEDEIRAIVRRQVAARKVNANASTQSSPPPRASPRARRPRIDDDEQAAK